MLDSLAAGRFSLAARLINDHGLDLTGWTLNSARSVPADGMTIGLFMGRRDIPTVAAFAPNAERTITRKASDKQPFPVHAVVRGNRVI